MRQAQNSKKKKFRRKFTDLEDKEKQLRAEEYWSQHGRFQALKNFETDVSAVENQIQAALDCLSAQLTLSQRDQRVLYEAELQRMKETLEAQTTEMAHLETVLQQQHSVIEELSQKLLVYGIDIEEWNASSSKVQKFSKAQVQHHKRTVRAKEKMKFVIQTESALIVQKLWKKFVARRDRRRMMQSHEEEKAAAITIQGLYRQIQFQKSRKERKSGFQNIYTHEAALLVQHVFKSRKCRSRLMFRREFIKEGAGNMVKGIALLLQRIGRGMRHRKIVKEHVPI
eukprot:PhF_6_TR8666/c0_g1_i1/m.13555